MKLQLQLVVFKSVCTKHIQIVSSNLHSLNMAHDVKSINFKGAATVVCFNDRALCCLMCVTVGGNFKGSHVSHTN